MQAFILYEEAIPDRKAQVTALQSIVSTLHRCRIFTPENRDVLVHKATGYSAKLLKKADQCRAVCTCSHLFWQEEEVIIPTSRHCVLFMEFNKGLAYFSRGFAHSRVLMVLRCFPALSCIRMRLTTDLWQVRKGFFEAAFGDVQPSATDTLPSGDVTASGNVPASPATDDMQPLNS